MDKYQTEILLIKKDGDREELIHAVVVPNYKTNLYSNLSLKEALYDFVNITQILDHEGKKEIANSFMTMRNLMGPYVFITDFDEYNSYSVHFITSIVEEEKEEGYAFYRQRNRLN